VIEVIFEPYGRKAQVPENSLIAEAAVAADVWVDVPCGGKGICGKCRVLVQGTLSPLNTSELDHLSEEERSQGYRLACQTRLLCDAVVRIPDSRLNRHAILINGTLRKITPDSAVEKRRFKVEPPSLNDQRSDAERLQEKLGSDWGEQPVPLSILQILPKVLQQGSFEVTAVGLNQHVISIEPGNTTGRCYGMAFDIGTTTVVGYLIDLETGEQLTVSSGLNEQAMLGDDVISRIEFAGQSPEGVTLLREKVLAVVNRIIQDVAAEAKISPLEIYQLILVGNTCMSHLFFGIDPGSLGHSPYVPVVRDEIRVSVAEAGVMINPRGVVASLPNIGSFVGADTLAVVLATNMHHMEPLKLAVDIGTNGELVLGNKDRLIACSTAAGPAFEGARISSGMRGTSGAIDSVEPERNNSGRLIGISYTTLDDASPRGLCGSGLFDLVAVLLEAGMIDFTGRLINFDELSEGNQSLGGRLLQGDSGSSFLVVPGEETATGKPILLTQRDIRELQLAKGAIHAGIRVLCNELEIAWSDVQEVLLAGAFGNYVRKQSALRIGLIPEIALDQVHAVGNAAGAGARLALVSRKLWQEADALKNQIDYLELAGRVDFQNEFAEAMLFPECEDA
jgi:uncharacterized 2Fe-2S/4Fe-4S cluster protein (DUF4445 family)